MHRRAPYVRLDESGRFYISGIWQVAGGDNDVRRIRHMRESGADDASLAQATRLLERLFSWHVEREKSVLPTAVGPLKAGAAETLRLPCISPGFINDGDTAGRWDGGGYLYHPILEGREALYWRGISGKISFYPASVRAQRFS